MSLERQDFLVWLGASCFFMARGYGAVIFYNYDIHSKDRVSYKIELDGSRAGIQITPIRLGENESSHAASETFYFDPARIKDDHNLRPFWLAHSCWALESRAGGLSLGQLHPVYPQTVLHKGPFLTHNPIFPRKVLFYVPYEESSIEEISVLAYIHPETHLEGSLPSTRVYGRGEVEDICLPKLRIHLADRCPVNGVLEGEVRLMNPGATEAVHKKATVYLEADCGYLSHRKIELQEGRGRFCFQPLHLKSGETATIKAGFKYYSGKATVQVLTL